MGDHLDFDKIVQEFRGSFHDVKFKMDSSSLTFKNRTTGKTEKVENNDIENLYWLKRAKGHCFNVTTSNGANYKFDGFGESDYSKLDDFTSKYFKKSLEKKDMSVKGWNWGKPNFKGDVMVFEQDGKPAFELPLKNISNTAVVKNEACLQFTQNEDAAVSMMEIRFHVPSAALIGGETENIDTDAAQEFIAKVLEKADIQVTSDAEAICTLTELNCITPRGRYDVKFFTDFVDLHGKTFDYKISYEHILRLFLLPHKDGRQMYFVIALDPPMKQGNTRYPFLIVLFNIEENITVDLTVSEKTKEKFGDRMEKLDNPMSGPYHEVVSRICRTVLDKKITVPGNFTTASGSKCYSCSCKANSGFLYPLERGFMFVNKPPLHILFSDIKCVKFDRSSQGTRSFDFEIEHKNGTKHIFNGIEKSEQERLGEFIKQKGINISKANKSVQKTLAHQNDSDSDDDHDAYAERMKAEGKQRDDDSDDDEEDEDFKAEESSDEDMEYDSQASIDSNTSNSGESGKEDKKDKDDSKSKKKSSKKSREKSPVKRKEKSSPKDKAKKSKSSSSKSPAKGTPESKTPKSAEFVEDSPSTDSD
jgi:structure-specific recognition protein 1